MLPQNTSGVGHDPWVFDSFTWFDHDYQTPTYLQELKERGFNLWGNWPVLCKNKNDPNPLNQELRIVTLGGSTTSVVNNSTWCEHLFSLLYDNFPSVALFNGGCGLYNSFNEYMKLSRDIYVLKPTHVISMSGVNNTNSAENISNAFASMLVEPLINGNLYTRQNVNYPPVHRTSRWIDEANSMNAICNSLNSEFIRYLQPCLCSTFSPFSELSEELQNLVLSMGDVFRNREVYINAVTDFYKRLSEINLPSYIQDITHIIPNEIQYWDDARHPSDAGYAIIAQHIYSSYFEHLAK